MSFRNVFSGFRCLSMNRAFPMLSCTWLPGRFSKRRSWWKPSCISSSRVPVRLKRPVLPALEPGWWPGGQRQWRCWLGKRKCSCQVLGCLLACKTGRQNLCCWGLSVGRTQEDLPHTDAAPGGQLPWARHCGGHSGSGCGHWGEVWPPASTARGWPSSSFTTTVWTKNKMVLCAGGQLCQHLTFSFYLLRPFTAIW